MVFYRKYFIVINTECELHQEFIEFADSAEKWYKREKKAIELFLEGRSNERDNLILLFRKSWKCIFTTEPCNSKLFELIL